MCFRPRSITAGLVVTAALAGASPLAGLTVPLFARRYNVPCTRCHVIPPKLNAFGEQFRRDGYRGPGLTAGQTIPVALWLSGRLDDLTAAPGLAEEVVEYLNRVELIAAGRAVSGRLAYFVEWRALSRETRGDGTLRDRSGRFEDLLVSTDIGPVALTVGQFRLVDQVDVSLRLGLSEPLALAASLPGGGTGSSREVGLRGFAPGGRSPAVRAGWTGDVGGWKLTASAAVPFPGEITIPLSDEARIEASRELEPKGMMLESYLRRGLYSIGLHGFTGTGQRRLLTAVHSGGTGRFFWTAMAGLDRSGPGAPTRTRLSAEAEFVPHRFAALGTRVENRSDDTAPTSVIPYLLLQAPGTRFTVRLTVEQRLQRDRNATFIELGTVF